jgi:hypothetical protein
VRHVACVGEMRIPYRILVIRPEWKRSLRKLLYRWESNVKKIYILKLFVSVMVLWGLGRPCFVIRSLKPEACRENNDSCKKRHGIQVYSVKVTEMFFVYYNMEYISNNEYVMLLK